MVKWFEALSGAPLCELLLNRADIEPGALAADASASEVEHVQQPGLYRPAATLETERSPDSGRLALRRCIGRPRARRAARGGVTRVVRGWARAGSSGPGCRTGRASRSRCRRSAQSAPR